MGPWQFVPAKPERGRGGWLGAGGGAPTCCGVLTFRVYVPME